jgi:hypothetical protein
MGMVFVAVILIAIYMFSGTGPNQMADKTGANVEEQTVQDHYAQKMQQDVHEKTDSSETKAGVVEKQIRVKPVIAYKNSKNPKKNASPDQMMENRLHALGIKKSLDMIVRSDESFIVGDKKVSMANILEKAFTRRKKIFETRITESEETAMEQITEYGIYVVQPGDNIWNIHFNILKEYYTSKGIVVPFKADEPLGSGHSSGVGKILKFSETMVIIYNLIDKEIVTDINLLEPLSKIVIYNLDEVFALLAEIDYDAINQIQFDGRTIWIPYPES